MKKMFLSIALSVLLVVCAWAPGYGVIAERAYAASLPVSVSDAYMSSGYYTAACNAYAANSGSDIQRFVQIALSQKGYVGGTSSGQWAGNGSGGRYTEYGRYMGNDGKDWCASFVSWCAAAAGISNAIIPKDSGAGYWRSHGNGSFHYLWSNGYTTYNDYKPQVGDLALYMPYCTTCNKHYNADSPTAHVVIVAAVGNSQNSDGSWSFTTIERGNGNTVASNNLTTKTTRGSLGTCTCGKQTPANTYAWVVQGFYHPDWGTSSTPSTPAATPSSSASVLYPTDSKYTAKISIGETNAVLCANIQKSSGSNCSRNGIRIYSAGGSLIKDYYENVTNVSASNTSFHTWFDLNSEAGVSLTPGTTYQYEFYTVVDGKTYTGQRYSFTTKGTAPAGSSSGGFTSGGSNTGGSNTGGSGNSGTKTYITYQIYFDANGGSCSKTKQDVYYMEPYGSLPVPVRAGYNFTGWYTEKSGGTKANSTDIYTTWGDQALYAHWMSTSGTYSLYLDANGGTCSSKTMTVTQGSPVGTMPVPTKEGCVFAGWYTVNGNLVTAETIYNSNKDQSLVAQWSRIKQEETPAAQQNPAVDTSNRLTFLINSSQYAHNGTVKEIDSNKTAPIIRNNRTLLPIRCVVEAMGGSVSWDASSRSVTMTKGDSVIVLIIDSTTAVTDQGLKALDCAPVIINSRTMLPVRFVAEYFGGSVSWDADAKAVGIRW